MWNNGFIHECIDISLARDVSIMVYEGSHSAIDTATRVQILNEVDYISHSTKTLGNAMIPINLPPAISK